MKCPDTELSVVILLSFYLMVVRILPLRVCDLMLIAGHS
ncbi:hypothetical protein T4A_3737 [Trichinella pseudospiralis]|uniref:Uncharacterized protein n=1 Tax=Trichinella pseudospiralis TaxID=6337 RepID=A0A0V1DMH3_TRIPS|nr:hypothetical protein T4A_3737 [Trichinella pseudospiralis]